MAATSGSTRRVQVPRAAWYGLLSLFVVAPVAAFVVAGLDAGDFGLRGAGGPMVAFSAGVLSFLSPCVLPLVPIFITQLAGASVENGQVTARRGVTFSHAVAFVLGLSAVFILLGASAGLLGGFLTEHQRDLEQGSGLLLIALGALLVPGYERRSPAAMAGMLLALVALLFVLVELADLRGSPFRTGILTVALAVLWARFSGFLPLNLFARTVQFNPGKASTASYGRSALVGGAFATGWTPCVGPILGGILTLAATSGDVWTGIYLLVAYSAGFSIPFLITGLAVSDASRGLKRVQRYIPAMEVASAVMMVGLGILLVSGRLTALNEYFGFAEFNQGL
ncbi:MAG: cytochrome c biogenesis CcdA family protein [Dehalococcoidia bacterium]